MSGDLAIADKISGQLRAIDVPAQIQGFREVAERVGQQLSGYIMGDDIEFVLFWGMLFLVVGKFLGNLGLFAVPLYVAVWSDRSERPFSPSSTVFFWAAALYSVILAVFVLNKFFMAGRFVAWLNILLIPVLSWGVWRLWSVRPRWRWLFVLIVMATAIDGLVSSSPPKTRYPEAAAWIAAQGLDPGRIYFEELVVPYLAGMGYSAHPSVQVSDRKELERAISERRFELFVISGRPYDPELAKWAEGVGIEPLVKFVDKSDRAVHIFGFPKR